MTGSKYWVRIEATDTTLGWTSNVPFPILISMLESAKLAAFEEAKKAPVQVEVRPEEAPGAGGALKTPGFSGRSVAPSR